MSGQKPKVGVGIFILKDGKVLLGKRRGSHGEGEYAFPGGHLEYMESFEDCGKRELAEECGVEVENIRFQFLANVTKYAPKHYVHVGLMADWKHGEPKILEVDKCESWGWYDLNNLPEPLFEICKLSIHAYKENQKYFDAPQILGFHESIVPQVFDGKISTWRVRDHKLKVGDVVAFENSQTKEIFGFGEITKVIKTTVGEIDLKDKTHYKTYEDRQELKDAFKKYNPSYVINNETTVFAYTYKFTKINK